MGCPERYSTLTPVEFFKLFVGENVISLFVTETKKFVQHRFENNMNISAEEIKVFLGTLTLSDYIILPGKKMLLGYQKFGMNNKLVSECMRRDRYLFICRYFRYHVRDNSSIQCDKMFKLRPLITILKSKCMNQFISCELLDYDQNLWWEILFHTFANNLYEKNRLDLGIKWGV